MAFEEIDRYSLPNKELVEFCQRWRIVELGIFGSAAREDFGPQSDIDVLVSFAPDSPWSLFDLVSMREELTTLLGRDVDLVEKEALRNPFRRREILRNLEIVYAT
jgi:hypothetical protein